MANVTINSLPTASTIDATNDLLPIYTNSLVATQAISRNTYLNLSSQPVGLTDSQTLTNKILTSPTINGATLSGTLAGTYTIGGTPTFPSSVTQNTVVQTLTNKTLTSPTITSPTITNATISADTLTGYTVSNNGTIYGMSVTSGTIGSAALAANSVTNASILTGNLYTTKIYNPYKFSAYLTADQTGLADNATTKINFNATKFDTSSNFASNKFTVPITGFYQINAFIRFYAPSANGVAFGAQLYKNGTAISNGGDLYPNFGTGNSSVMFANINEIVSLVANDYLEIYAVVDVLAGTATITGGLTYSSFSGFLVSAT